MGLDLICLHSCGERREKANTDAGGLRFWRRGEKVLSSGCFGLFGGCRPHFFPCHYGANAPRCTPRIGGKLQALSQLLGDFLAGKHSYLEASRLTFPKLGKITSCPMQVPGIISQKPPWFFQSAPDESSRPSPYLGLWCQLCNQAIYLALWPVQWRAPMESLFPRLVGCGAAAAAALLPPSAVGSPARGIFSRPASTKCPLRGERALYYTTALSSPLSLEHHWPLSQ